MRWVNQQGPTYVLLTGVQTFGTGIDHPLRKRGVSLKESSEAFISSHLGVDSLYHSGFSSDVASHAYANQIIVSSPHG